MYRLGLFFVVVAACLWLTGSAFGQTGDDSLREQAKTLNTITGDAAILAKIRELVKDKDHLKKLLVESMALVKGSEKNQPLNYNACYILARAAHVTKQHDSAEFFYKQCIEHAFKLRSIQKQAQVFEGLIDLFERRKRFDEALFTCQKFLDLQAGDRDNIEQVKPFVVERMVQILCKQKKFDDAMKMVDKMVELDEGGWYFLHRKAEVLRESGKYQEAESLYKDVLKRIDESDRLDDKQKKRFTEHCQYVLSSVYIDLNQVDKSVEVLENLVKDNPENASFNNDLGYILADHDMRLEEAKKLIDKALKIDRAERKKLMDEKNIDPEDNKDNSAYLDSLAWVLHKQKKHAEALEIMKKVVEYDESQHPEIFDHLGEIYLALGNKSEAVKAWKKALTLDDASLRDVARKEAIKKKIQANQSDD